MDETRGLKSSANSAGAELLTIARADRGALRPLAGERSFEEMETALDRAREVLAEREIWHVTGSAVGGMAEVLGAILGYVRDGGINARWAKLRAGEEFFSITHRLYDGLYGSPSSGLSLRPGDRDIYERTLARTADSLLELIREGDVVVLHDPPTAGLVEPMREAGARVAWRCHLGIDRPSPAAEEAQRFLLPHVQAADAYVFSHREFVWPELEESKAWIVPPSINPLSPKNQELEPATVTAILDRIGLTADGSESPPTIDLLDGSPLRVDFPALIEQVRPIPETSHVVAQLSNWDRLKDPQGLLKCFAEHCTGEIDLVLAGPDPTAIPEEPGSEELWAELVADVEALPDEIAERIHLLALPVEYPAGTQQP